MSDRYTKIVLTVIATALVYLCVVFTPLPGLHAQQTTMRPGEFTGPGEIVIVGWRLPPNETVPVSIHQTVPVSIADTVRVATERSSGRADRVMIAGWEEQATPDKPGRTRAIEPTSAGLPVSSIPK
jgi:hypothetical protein